MQTMVLSGIRPSFPGLSQSAGQITHVLLTRSPLESPPKGHFPFDLHVLSTPPAFVLSQDQTLQTKPKKAIQKYLTKKPHPDKREKHEARHNKKTTNKNHQTHY